MTAIWWVRRDMRVHDNPALLEAQRDDAVAVFPWSPAVDSWSPRRRGHLARVLGDLNQSCGGALAVRSGYPAEVLSRAASEVRASRVWAHREYSPAGIREQEAAAQALAAHGIDLELVGSPYAVAPGRVLKSDRSEYRVFTPFRNAWREHGWRGPATRARDDSWVVADGDVNLDQVIADADSADPLQERPPATEAAALEALAHFVDSGIHTYASERDRPDLDTTARLSIGLAHGQIHPRTILAATAPITEASARTFESELAWREFHADVLFHHPRAQRESLTPVIGDDAWVTGAQADESFAAWVEGRTGFPIVDAGMRQLAATGWMHNRVRMVVASFLIKDLHIPWQRGANYFRDALLDYDHAQNQLNWQWVAGTGRDAAPYFRVFNPTTQASKFDPTGAYARRWIPELDTAQYPQPMVDHAAERDISLGNYQRGKALRA